MKGHMMGHWQTVAVSSEIPRKSLQVDGCDRIFRKHIPRPAWCSKAPFPPSRRGWLLPPIRCRLSRAESRRILADSRGRVPSDSSPTRVLFRSSWGHCPVHMTWMLCCSAAGSIDPARPFQRPLPARQESRDMP